MKRTTKRNEAGSTMVELLIATAVFVTGMSALLGTTMTLTTHSQVANDRARAVNFSRSTFEDLRGLSIQEILAYDIPLDNAEAGTVTVPGVGTATVNAFAIIPNGQGGFSSFQLGVDDPQTLDVNNLPNPIEIRVVMTPVHSTGGGQSTMNQHFYSTTMVSY